MALRLLLRSTTDPPHGIATGSSGCSGAPSADSRQSLRYNRGGAETILGRGQVARHRVLVPGSQVRILPPQPAVERRDYSKELGRDDVEGGTLPQTFAVVLAAGKGTRMKSNRAKVLHTLCGVPMVNYVIEALKPLASERLLVVVGHQAELVEAVLPQDAETVLQREQLGTGDAVGVALEALGGEEEGVLLVVNGDGPLISERTLEELVERHRSAGVGATVLVAELDDPSGLGRVVEDAGVVKIVEERDATEDGVGDQARQPRSVRVQAIGDQDAVGRVARENSQGELYLTDVLEIIGRRSRAVTYRLKNLEEANLVNDRSQLARAEEILRRRILDAHMRDGVTVRDPDSTHIEASVEIGRDTVILPGTFLRGATIIGSDCVIGPSADLLDTVVADGARVEHSVGRGAEVGRGPPSVPTPSCDPGRLDPMPKWGPTARSRTRGSGGGAGAPLSTSGTRNREDANVGAGTITANYDGVNKNRTTIGDGAFTGVNTNLIAPVTIGRTPTPVPGV